MNKNWYKTANINDISEKIKSILRSHPFVQNLMQSYHISNDDIDKYLEIEIGDLKGKFAEGNGRKIVLDKKLFQNNFFKDSFHFVIHEFFHWMKRRYEKSFYFHDPEEIQSFVLAITWELISGKKEAEIKRTIYPIIKTHFKEKDNSDELFADMFSKAIDMYKTHKSTYSQP